jgi:hypothetical protein
MWGPEQGMRAIRMTIATAVASVMTVFAILGMVHLVELVAAGLQPNPIAVSDLRLDFGRIPLHGVATQTLVVRNEGTGPLHALFLVVDDSYAVEPDELILEPGVEWSITVMASPDRPGRLYDMLRIQIVGGDIAPVVIPLAAEAGPEEAEAEPGWEINRV